MAFSSAMHVVGVLYAIPVTRRNGIMATYEPECTTSCPQQRPIRILYPAPQLNTIFLVVAPTTAFIAGVVPALISACLYDKGDYKSSSIWLDVRHWAQTASIVYRDKLIRDGVSQYTHFCAIMWTCLLPAAALVYLGLVHAQLLHNRRLRPECNNAYKIMESGNGSGDTGSELGQGSRPTGEDPDVERAVELGPITQATGKDVLECETHLRIPQMAMRNSFNLRQYFSSQRISSLENSLVYGYSQYFSSEYMSGSTLSDFAFGVHVHKNL
ncbi:hypothetical protein EC968_004421 [Mortierella alpina]|nr:hypothetical protein EC968_004421 [Mortierella alpina]